MIIIISFYGILLVYVWIYFINEAHPTLRCIKQNMGQK